MNFGQLKAKIEDYIKKISKKYPDDPATKFRITNYNRVIDTIESLYKPHILASKPKLDAMNLTEHMRMKLLEFINGQNVNRDEKASNTLFNELLAIKGIGENRANMLIQKGLTNIKQLKLKKWQEFLTEETKLFLSLKPADKIPHEDIRKLEPKIMAAAALHNLRAVLVGSYRRKKRYSRDIDVMIVDNRAHALEMFLDGLESIFNKKHVITYSKGNDKLSVMIIINTQQVYKLDAFRIEPESEVSMLLYSTGSKANNIAMRAKAKRMGFLLNQNGLFRANGAKIPGLNSEEDYYRALNMPYKKPEERI